MMNCENCRHSLLLLYMHSYACCLNTVIPNNIPSLQREILQREEEREHVPC